MGLTGGSRDPVPLVRAMWFLKVTVLKESIDKVQNEEPLSVQVKSREAVEKRTIEFTEELIKYLLDHFLEFARSKGGCDAGRCVEQLVRKWAYMVRLVDWTSTHPRVHLACRSQATSQHRQQGRRRRWSGCGW